MPGGATLASPTGIAEGASRVSSGQFGLADLVTGIGLFTISLCVVASLTSGYYYLRKDQKEFSKHFDRASWVAIFLGYAALNVVLPLAAFS